MSHPLLDALGPELRSQFRASARRRSFRKGEIVFHQGDPGESLHLVESGGFAVQVFAPTGHTMLMRLVGRGEHFGELSIASPDQTRSATLFAVEASRTLSIGRREFDELRRREPAVDRLLVEALANRVRAETEMAMELAFVSADRRVYRRLVALASPGLRGESVDVDLSQEMLAELAGTTRATANRAVRALEVQGIVRLRRRAVTVVDLERLIAASQ